jgi:hypothetical protein
VFDDDICGISRGMIFAPLLLAVAIVPAGVDFTCTPIAVWDGDGPVSCAEGPRLRLAWIAAREIDGTCRDNQPCPAADAVQARDALRWTPRTARRRVEPQAAQPKRLPLCRISLVQMHTAA